MTATAKRRWLGVAALGSAITLLIVGETLLRGRLGPMVMLGYWTFCLLLTVVAVVIALADARATARRTLQELRTLFDATVKEIQVESLKRKQRNGKSDLESARTEKPGPPRR